MRGQLGDHGRSVVLWELGVRGSVRVRAQGPGVTEGCPVPLCSRLPAVRYYSSHSHLRLYRVRVHLHVQLWMQTLAQHHDHGRHDLAEMLQPSIAGDTCNH